MICDEEGNSRQSLPLVVVWLPRTRRRAAGRAVCMAGMVAVLGAGITGAPAPSSVTTDSRYYGGHMFTPRDTVHSE